MPHPPRPARRNLGWRLTRFPPPSDNGPRASLGVVRGNTVRPRHLGKDILAVFRNMIGGEVAEYTKLMAEAREQALDRMVAAAEMLAYGTAVVAE